MTTTVVHIRDGYDVYIGRANGRARLKGSIWANPFHIGRDGTREDVIAKYRAWIMEQPALLAQVGTLKGKRLGCFCSPQQCHGDVLTELAEGTDNHMKVLSLTQPYATLVIVGAKKIETRGWPCPQALIGQRIAIHASKGFADMTTGEFSRLCCSEPFKTTLRAAWRYGIPFGEHEEGHLYPGDLPRGVILGTARITGCWSTNRDELVAKLPASERAFGFYGPDRWMWGLDRAQVFPEPIPAKGKLGLWVWDPPEEVAA